VLLHLGHEDPARVSLGDLDLEGGVDLGKRSAKTASMTTPLISMIRPVFVRDVSAMVLLRRRTRAAKGRPGVASLAKANWRPVAFNSTLKFRHASAM
jgi:hypothetical protein